LSIDVGNSFNYEHLDKFNDSRAINLSIDVGNSFNFLHLDKFNDSRAINFSIDAGNSFNSQHLICQFVNYEHPDKSKD